jgi:hypothetical protein
VEWALFIFPGTCLDLQALVLMISTPNVTRGPDCGRDRRQAGSTLCFFSLDAIQPLSAYPTTSDTINTLFNNISRLNGHPFATTIIRIPLALVVKCFTRLSTPEISQIVIPTINPARRHRRLFRFP